LVMGEALEFIECVVEICLKAVFESVEAKIPWPSSYPHRSNRDLEGVPPDSD